MTMMNGMMNERLDYDFPRDTGPLTGPAAFPQMAPPMAPPMQAGEMIAPMRLPIPATGMTDPRIEFAMQDAAIQPIPPRLPMQPAGEMLGESMIGEAPTFPTPMPPIRPAGEMLGERQLTPMDQTALPMQAQADLTRTATMGTPPPIVNPWDYNPMWPVQSMFDSESSLFPMTPGTQGFLDWQDPYFQHRWNTGYKPFLNRLAGAMFPPYGAYNLYNQFIR